MLQLERLREVLLYCPSSGVFKWKKKLSPRALKGAIAGSIEPNGYVRISIDGKLYLGHRLAWFHFYGVMPQSDIDHINTNRQSNWILNLRLCTTSQNGENQIRAHKGNSTGYLGVSRHGLGFQATIMTNGVKKVLGTCNTAEEAHDLYLDAKRMQHEFNTL